jgi:tetrahydromethanopterin S-methyltransferase subunit G
MNRTCENRVPKIAKYLSATNVSGSSYQKCGRKMVTESEFGKALCKKCAKDLGILVGKANGLEK